MCLGGRIQPRRDPSANRKWLPHPDGAANQGQLQDDKEQTLRDPAALR